MDGLLRIISMCLSSFTLGLLVANLIEVNSRIKHLKKLMHELEETDDRNEG